MPANILPIKGAIQHYDWGGFDFIPQLLDIKNTTRQPFAELWMGAHPSAPAITTLNGKTIPLDQLVQAAPVEILGQKVASAFQNRLPYLFKVLDVQKMLSIQAHPTKKQAEEGFRRENEEGIPLDAPNRNYKDNNHKPEVMVALTDFWLLHGFKPLSDIEHTLQAVPEFASLLEITAKGSIYDLYRFTMEMPQSTADAMLQPLHKRLTNEQPAKDSPDFWAKRAFTDHPPRDGHYDRGIFSIYMFHLLHLKPGEGIFQGAGVPHAYLEGVNMELMANSDNVFRGGLTNKHVDVHELLKSLVFEAVTPHIIQGDAISSTEVVYRTPAPDFELSKIEVGHEKSHECVGVEAPHMLIVLEGEITVNTDSHFRRGEIFFVPAGLAYFIRSETKAILFKATVP